jgi:hypothetical protein
MEVKSFLPKIYVRSVGVQYFGLTSSEDDLKHLPQTSHRIFQEYLAGMEHVANALCDLDKKPLVAILRVRLKKDVKFLKGEVITDPQIEQNLRDYPKIC